MARRSTGKPWLHEKSGYWCTSVDRKRVYLDKDYKVACRKLRQLKADRKKSDQGASNEWLVAPIGAWPHRHTQSRTFRRPVSPEEYFSEIKPSYLFTTPRYLTALKSANGATSLN